MFGEDALRLVNEAKAAVALDTVKPYNDHLVRALILETKQLHSHLTTLIETLGTPSAEAQSQLLIVHLMVQHNKRALLIYHNTRIDILHRALTAAFASLPILFTTIPQTSLSPAELAYLRSLAALLHRTKLAHLAHIDITAPTPLPRSTLVTVRITKDLTDIWISDAYTHPVTLQKGQTLTINATHLPLFLKHRWATII